MIKYVNWNAFNSFSRLNFVYKLYSAQLNQNSYKTANVGITTFLGLMSVRKSVLTQSLVNQQDNLFTYLSDPKISTKKQKMPLNVGKSHETQFPQSF